MRISAWAKSTAPGALAAKLLPIQDGRVFDSGTDPCKACTIKRDGKHLLGAGTAVSLARKYGLRRCVGHSLTPRERTPVRPGTERSDFWEMESRGARRHVRMTGSDAFRARAPLAQRRACDRCFWAPSGSCILEPFHVNGSERAFSSGVPLETESAVASRAPQPTPGCGCGDNERPGWTARTRLSPADSDPAFEARGLREEPRAGLGLQWSDADAQRTAGRRWREAGAGCWRKEVRRSVGAVRGFQPARQYCCATRFGTQRLSFPQVVGDGPFLNNYGVKKSGRAQSWITSDCPIPDWFVDVPMALKIRSGHWKGKWDVLRASFIAPDLPALLKLPGILGMGSCWLPVIPRVGSTQLDCEILANPGNLESEG